MISGFDTKVLNSTDSKAAIDAVRGQNWGRKKTNSQLVKRIAKGVSFRGCQDKSFKGLLQKLQVWYPVR